MYHATNLSVTNTSVSFKTSTDYTATGAFLNKYLFSSVCPALSEAGYVFSCTVNTDIASHIRMGYENSPSGTYVSMDIPVGNTRISFQTKEATNNISFYITNKTGATITLSDFQVEAGSTATAFSPYATLCPINLGKNLFNPAQTPTYINGYATVSQITNGVRVTSTRTSTSTTSAFDSALYAVVRADDYIGKPLSLSIGTMSPSTSGNQRAIIGVCNADASVRESKVSVNTANSRGTYTPTDADRGKYIYVSLYAINGVASPAGSYVDYKNIQFEMNYTITAYTAYLEPIELRKINNHQDYIYKSDGDWYVHREIDKVVLNGSESDWVVKVNNTAKTAFGHIISGIESYSDPDVVPNLMSDRYTPQSYNGTWNKGNISRWTGTARMITLVMQPGLELADFKTWLASNNTSVYYVLATPTETKITNSTLISQLNALWSASTYGDDTVLTIGAVDLQAIGTDIFQSTRRIEKFYGSVNGVTKLIYEE